MASFSKFHPWAPVLHLVSCTWSIRSKLCSLSCHNSCKASIDFTISVEKNKTLKMIWFCSWNLFLKNSKMACCKCPHLHHRPHMSGGELLLASGQSLTCTMGTLSVSCLWLIWILSLLHSFNFSFLPIVATICVSLQNFNTFQFRRTPQKNMNKAFQQFPWMSVRLQSIRLERP